MSRIYLSRSEKRGMLAVGVALVLVASVAVWLWYHPEEQVVAVAPMPVQTSYGRKPAKPFAVPERRVETFSFDPNTADSTTLLRLGLTPAMVRGIYKYRAMGYVYSFPEDFSRVPGMTRGMWNRLAPMITIAPEFQPMEPIERPHPSKSSGTTAAPLDTVETPPAAQPVAVRRPKLHVGQTIDVNTADTTLLKQVPGIGSYYAAQVVRYRERLGGFAGVEQVAEVKGFPAEALDFLTASQVPLRKFSINKISRRALLSHPYMSVEQARSVWEYRCNEGSLHGESDLLLLPGFRPSDVERLLPYLDFSE